MLTFCGPPAAGTAIVSGATAALHPVPWVMVKVCPPTVIVPVRDGDVFAAAANCTVPGPFPFEPEVMLTHGAFGVAVQVQESAALTVNDPAPPPAGIVCPVGAMVNEQPLV